MKTYTVTFETGLDSQSFKSFKAKSEKHARELFVAAFPNLVITEITSL